MTRLALVLVAACGSTPVAKPVAPLPAASTSCYAGIETANGAKTRVLLRRTVDPAAREIREDIGADKHSVATVEGDRFTVAGSTTSGTLTGDPWRWTAWTSRAVVDGTSIDAESELTATGLKSTKQARKDGKVLGTATDELQTFDCAKWDAAIAEVARPVLEVSACERACRNYAKLNYATVADGTPEDFEQRVADGLAACVNQCKTADNDAQTECFATAKTLAEAKACN